MKTYNMDDAADFLGLKPSSVMQYARRGMLGRQGTDGEFYFNQKELMEYRKERKKTGPTETEWKNRFDKRYGKGKYNWVRAALENPSVHYRDIAAKLGVTTKYVYKLRQMLRPELDIPEMRAAATRYQHKKRLLENELVGSFCKAAYANGFKRPEITAISTGKDLRRSALKLRGKKVLLRKATRQSHLPGARGRITYLITRPEEQADYIFYAMSGRKFLFIPYIHMQPARTTIYAAKDSLYAIFMDSFDSFHPSEGQGKTSQGGFTRKNKLRFQEA